MLDVGGPTGSIRFPSSDLVVRTRYCGVLHLSVDADVMPHCDLIFIYTYLSVGELEVYLYYRGKDGKDIAI